MKIGSFSGSTAYTARFETPCQKIAVVAVGDTVAHIEDATLTLNMMDRNGNLKTITPKTRLGDLMEIAASNEGCVNYIKNASTYDVRGTIELSNFGAIDIQGGYFSIQLDGCTASNSFDLYALEAKDLTNSIINYRPIWVAANQYKDVQAGDAYMLAVPVSTIDELHITHKGKDGEPGRTNIYTLEELKAIAQETNEIAIARYNYTSSVYEMKNGFANFLCIGLSNVASVRVRCTAESNLYLVSDEQLKNLKKWGF